MALIIAYKHSALLFKLPRAEVGGTTSACHRMFNGRNILMGCQYQIGHFRRCRTAEPQRSHVSMRGVGSVALRGLASRTLALSSVLSRRMSLAQFLDR